MDEEAPGEELPGNKGKGSGPRSNRSLQDSGPRKAAGDRSKPETRRGKGIAARHLQTDPRGASGQHATKRVRKLALERRGPSMVPAANDDGNASGGAESGAALCHDRGWIWAAPRLCTCGLRAGYGASQDPLFTLLRSLMQPVVKGRREAARAKPVLAGNEPVSCAKGHGRGTGSLRQARPGRDGHHGSSGRAAGLWAAKSGEQAPRVVPRAARAAQACQEACAALSVDEAFAMPMSPGPEPLTSDRAPAIWRDGALVLMEAWVRASANRIAAMLRGAAPNADPPKRRPEPSRVAVPAIVRAHREITALRAENEGLRLQLAAMENARDAMT